MNPEFLEIADRIGARLCRDALWSGGRCNWTGEHLEDGAIAYGSLGPQIYSGTSGIALFLWRLAEATGDRIVRLTARAALRQALSRMPQEGCGLYGGGLGILYAAAEIEGAGDAEAVLRQAAPDRGRLDIVSGSAGAIGGLLRIDRRLGGGRWTEAAAAHGDLLLAEAERTAEGWSWKGAVGSRNLTGFSHGAAGIGWALAELWKATGEARFGEGAREAFRYERSCFDAAAGNWPDFRGDAPKFAAVWCHGAGGIGFSRLRAWQILREEELLAEARTALAAVAETLLADVNFCLCHGIAGNGDLMIYAASVLGEDGWREKAEEAGRQGAARYERRSAPWPCGLPRGHEVPGLMLGMAGIGYFYLRLADEAGTPTMLLPGSP